jgi:serine/threonine protein kinase
VGQTLGRYNRLEHVGEGGCGVVYVAEQTEPVRRRVALKVIKLGIDTKAVVARFEAERQALALMDHPNIAKVLDAGTTGDSRGADFSPQGRSSVTLSSASLERLPGAASLRDESRAPGSK